MDATGNRSGSKPEGSQRSAVGTAITDRPRPDPCERNSRTRLPPWVCDGETCRTRSSACDTRTRRCVRCVLCWLTFPLAPALRSTGSAAVGTALFVGFAAVESGEVELAPCLCPLAQTARAVFPQAAFLCGRHCGVEDALMPGAR